MADSGDAAAFGAVLGGIAGYKVSDGNAIGAVLGAGAGLVASGYSTENILGEPDS